MRIPIRLQLALLVLLTAFLALAAVSISTVSSAHTGSADDACSDVVNSG